MMVITTINLHQFINYLATSSKQLEVTLLSHIGRTNGFIKFST